MSEPKQCCGSLGPSHKKGCPAKAAATEPPATTAQEPAPSEPSKTELLERQVAELLKRDEENQKKLQMLYDVADKGRLFSWEQRQKTDRKPQKVNLSVFDGKTVIGWRTVRDELVTDPRTGRTVGENQEYELLLLDAGDGKSTHRINGYLNFSNARYDKRIECEVLSRSENFDGKVSCKVGLPDGRVIELDSRFLN